MDRGFCRLSRRRSGLGLRLTLRFWLFLFLFCLRLFTFRSRRVDLFSLFSNHGDRRADRDNRSLVDDVLQHDTAGRRLHFHRGLVCFDLGQHIAFVDRFAHLLHPADKRAFRHVEAQLGHIDCFSHYFKTSFTAATMSWA